MVDRNLDLEQLTIDLHDAEERFRHLREAVKRRQALASEVVELTARLRKAKRLLKEAGWDVESCIAATERRRTKRVDELGNGKGAGQ